MKKTSFIFLFCLGSTIWGSKIALANRNNTLPPISPAHRHQNNISPNRFNSPDSKHEWSHSPKMSRPNTVNNSRRPPTLSGQLNWMEKSVKETKEILHESSKRREEFHQQQALEHTKKSLGGNQHISRIKFPKRLHPISSGNPPIELSEEQFKTLEREALKRELKREKRRLEKTIPKNDLQELDLLKRMEHDRKYTK